MKLVAIIVNYRTARLTVEAIAALYPQLVELDGARAIVVDNDSQDGSFEEIRTQVAARGWADRVRVVQSGTNGGFGFGNNVGIRIAMAEDSPDYFYLLNSDAVPESGCTRSLLEFMETHSHVGLAGSYVHGPDGTPHRTAFRFPTWQSELETTLGIGLVSRLLSRWIVAIPLPKDAQQMDWVAGASMMIRTRVLKDVGLFDEGFFLYFEEVDLCRRARLAGWPTFYVPHSAVSHIGSASTGMKDLTRRTPAYYFESRRRYFLKNHGVLYLAATNMSWVAGYLVGNLLRYAFRRQRKEYPPHMFSDFVQHNFARRTSQT